MRTRHLVYPAVLIAAFALLYVASRLPESAAPSGDDAPDAPAAADDAERPAPDLPARPAGDDAAAAQGSGDLAILVVDEAGAPVAGARVTTRIDGVPAGTREAIAGAGGEVLFEKMPAGKVSVRAEAPPLAVPATRVVELADDHHSDARLVLVTGGAATGRVLGEDGLAVEGKFTVTLFRSQPASGRVNRRIGGRKVASRTFPAGTAIFEFAGLEPGEYRAEATSPGHVRGGSETFEVKKGAVTREVIVSLARGGRIAGVVVRATTGAPVAGADVSAGPERGSEFSWVGGFFRGGQRAKTDADGRFVLDGLPPGKYTVHARAKDLAPGQVPEVEVERDRQAGGVLVSLGEGGTITGTVYGPDGAPVPKAKVLVSRVMKGVRVVGDFGNSVTANERGVYVAEHLEPGPWRVRRPAGSSGAISLRMSMGGNEDDAEEEQGEDVVLVREGQVTRRDLHDERKCALSGVVVDGEGKPLRKTVQLREGDPPAASPGGGPVLALPRMARPDAKGRFSYENLDPGEWILSADGVEERVTIAPGETRKVRLVVPVGRIEGQVVDGAGTPVVGASISLKRQDRRGGIGGIIAFSSRGRVKTDDHGRFRLDDVAPGKYVVEASGKGGVGRTEEIDLAPGEVRRELRILLESTVEIRVRVRDGEGHPVTPGWAMLAEDRENRGVARLGDDGTATLRVLPGDYTLTVRRGGAPGEPHVERIVVGRGSSQTFEVEIE